MGAIVTRLKVPKIDIDQLCEVLPDLVVVVSVDSSILAANSAFEPITGHKVADWIGKSFRPLVAPEDLSHVEEAFQSVFESATPKIIETRVMRADGSSVFVQASVRAGFDANYGQVAFAVVRDITEKKELERLLEAKERRYRLLFEKNPCPMWVLDRKSWRFLVVNEAAVNQYGYSRDEFLSMTIAEIRPSEDIALVRASQREAKIEPMGNEVGDAGEWRHRKKDGTVFDVSITWVPFDWNGHDGALVMASDISRRKEAERKAAALTEKFRRSNEELDQFASLVSHDLQEPLRMITSYLGLLNRKYGDRLDKDAKEYLQFASSGASRLRRLILALLEYARSGVVKTRRGTETLRIVENVKSSLGLLIADAKATVDIESLPNVWVDPNLLTQVFQNLIANAIKFRGTDPVQISVSAERKGDEWVFSVADNGMGIDADKLERIFLPYERLHHFKQSEGTGLGLALTRKIIEAHGGRIWAESRVGYGSTFRFTIPIRPADHQEP